MLKETWRRSSSPAVWAVALVAGAPALVQAQTQLFPLAPIQRERVPCPMEDPVYGLYRHQYFGYYPTCWRPFPPGWGCPSPEAPNQAQEFQKLKRAPLPEGVPGPEPEPGLEPIPGENPTMPRNGRPAMPPLPPTERSPFDLDTTPNPPGGRMPEQGAPGGAAPRNDRSVPPAVPPTTSRALPLQAAPSDDEKGSEATAPLLALPDPAEGATSATPADSGPAAAPTGNAGAAGGPPTGGAPGQVSPALPGMVNPVSGRPVMSPNLPPNSPANVLAPSSVAPVAMPVRAPMPVQAPQRRGPISTLFSGLSARMRR
jgi:hypothetical protein